MNLIRYFVEISAFDEFWILRNAACDSWADYEGIGRIRNQMMAKVKNR